ncbi:MAG: hypothetical protein NVSMB19_10000 [Vulcanimicrobiaceae bacterium]
MIERMLTALETAVLGLWAGSMAGFAFIFAPLAIKAVPRLDVFAALVASVIRGIGSFGAVCGALAIVAALVRARAPESRRLAFLRIGLVAIALGGSAYESSTIVPRMEATAAQIPGPVDSVPKDDPRRVAYDAEHKASSRVYGTAFLCVLAALGLAGFGRKRAR